MGQIGRAAFQGFLKPSAFSLTLKDTALGGEKHVARARPYWIWCGACCRGLWIMASVVSPRNEAN
jgi:hypothetical protein